MVIRLMPEIPLGAVIDLGVFGTFRPGVPLETLSRNHGEPKTIRRDHAGTYYEYSHGDIKIEVAHERSMSGDTVWEQWAVYAYPASQSPSLLSSPLAKLIENDRPSEVILAGSGDPMVSMRFAADRLAMIRWYGVRTGDPRTQAP